MTDIQLPPGCIELRRITIIEYLDLDGTYLFGEHFEDHGNGFTQVQMLGMLEQAKVTVMAPAIRTWTGFDDEDDD